MCHRILVRHALVAKYAEYWRWLIGRYRVVARIEDNRVVTVAVRMAHRREVDC